MPIFDDAESTTYSEFFGAYPILDEEDIKEPAGIDNQNTMFTEGGCVTRNGFGPAFNPNVAIRVLYNWVQQAYNRILYLTGTTLVSHDLAGIITDFNILTGVSASGMTFLQAAYRIYMAFFDALGNSTGNVKVWDGMFTSGVPNIDDAFHATIQTTDLAAGSGGVGPGTWGTFSESGVGSVNTGTHFFALIPVTRNGFQTQPGPVNAGLFTPQSFTSTGGKTVTITVTPSTVWPSVFSTIQIAMTTAQNPNRWFLVPSVNGGGPLSIASGIPITFTVNIDDVTLTAETTEITNTLFNLFTGSLAVHFLVSYNNRNCYGARILAPDGLSSAFAFFVSDPYQPQYIIPSLNVLNLPEFRDGVTGFVLGGEVFVAGPSWTYAWRDNLNSPVYWPAPRLVSGEKGSPFIRGVSVNQASGYAWVADHSGLYCFTGANYSDVPASYFQRPIWDRINFAADANALSIEEVIDLRLVVVMAPLDGATHATHLLVWDCTEGRVPGKIKFCGLWNIQQFTNIGAIELVQAYPAKIKELWISRQDAAGKVLRLKSTEAGDATDISPTALYDDDGSGINSYYKALTVCVAEEGPAQQLGISIRERGNGQINLTAYSFDNDTSIPMAPIQASENSLAPGKRFYRTVDMQSEVAMYKWDNGAVPGSFFNVSVVKSFYTPWMSER